MCHYDSILTQDATLAFECIGNRLPRRRHNLFRQLRWEEKPYFFALLTAHKTAGLYSRSNDDVDQLHNIAIVWISHDAATGV